MHGRNPLCYVDGVGKEHEGVQAKGPGELDGFEICSACKATNLAEYEKGRDSLWIELTGFFGLLDGMTLKMIHDL